MYENKQGMMKNKKILIVGEGSYIGNNIKEYLESYEMYDIDIKNAINWNPEDSDFVGYDAVINVAGIAHIKETRENKELYYKINRDLCIKIAECAKQAKVSQFILLSSMSVYGKVEGHITKQTEASPVNAYGDSKLQADNAVLKLMDDKFKVAILRPPMVYGRGCRGNYQILRKFVLMFPVFPSFRNKRSMIYVRNLAAFVKNCIDDEKYGLFFPQDKEYVCTTDMVKRIAENNGKKITEVSVFNWAIRIMIALRIEIFEKTFANLTYEKYDFVDEFTFEEAMKEVER